MAETDRERGRRLRRIRRSLDETQAEFGLRFGKTGPAISHYEKGKMPHSAVLKGLHEMGYSVEWLLMGEGQMHRVGYAVGEEGEVLTTLMEGAEDGIVILQDGVRKFANKAMERITGYRIEELVGKSFLSLVTPDHRNNVLQNYEERIRANVPPDHHTVTIRCKDGSIKHLKSSFGSIQYRGKPAVLVIVRETTDLRPAETQRYVADLVGSQPPSLTGDERKLVKILKSLLDELLSENNEPE
jgi:PAS domain S-box-containing protein